VTGPEKPEKPRRSCLRMAVLALVYGLVALLLLGVAAGVAGYMVWDHVTRPGTPGAPVEVTIPEGATGQQAGLALAERGLVEHPFFWRLALRLEPTMRPVKHGRYEIPEGLSPVEMLQLLQEGPPPAPAADSRRVTIPEGLSIGQMASLFDDPDAFVEAASDPDLIRRMGVEADTLEGFLMPNTYFFSEEPEPRAVVERMLEQFEREMAALLREHPNPEGFNLLELVTVASLVEEEGRSDEERPLIAAVIHNRLKKGMPLQMDSTLQYIHGKYGQRMLNADKETDSPYNTYRHAGLPPGPISNPGVAALRAALQPADAPYLYFVSNADGSTHTFSATLSEHNRAVARFRKEIREQRRAQEQSPRHDP
jgi:UPF0755 protein